MRSVLFAPLILTAALGVPPAFAATAEGFCGDLNFVTATAKSGFSSLRGTQTSISQDANGDSTVHYVAKRVLTGALSCDVEEDQGKDGILLKSYVCKYAAAPTKVATVKDVAQNIVNCLGSNSLDEISTNVADDTADADIDRNDFQINVGAGTAPTVFLTIFGP